MTARFTIFFTVSILLFAAGAQAEEASKQALFDELFTVMKYDRIIDQMSEGIDAQLVTALRRKYPSLTVLPNMGKELNTWLVPVIQKMKGGLLAKLNKRLKRDGYEL